MPLVQVHQAEIAFKRQSLPAVRNVELSVSKGEFVTLVGPSGCGKSTLLRAIAGLQELTRGTLSVAGTTPQAARRSTTPMAFVFQDPTLLPWRTVAGNVRLPDELSRQRKSLTENRLSELLQLVGLKAEDALKRPRELSGGMRMRVSLARALATNPTLLFLDEPFAALDDVLRQQLNEELARLWQMQGWTALFVTHQVAEAVFLSQRVVIMSPRPGTIIREFLIPFPYPRKLSLRGEPEFARLCAAISQTLREQQS